LLTDEKQNPEQEVFHFITHVQMACDCKQNALDNCKQAGYKQAGCAFLTPASSAQSFIFHEEV
jgi:hypothetical protein